MRGFGSLNCGTTENVNHIKSNTTNKEKTRSDHIVQRTAFKLAARVHAVNRCRASIGNHLQQVKFERRVLSANAIFSEEKQNQVRVEQLRFFPLESRMAQNQDSTRPSTGKLHNELKQNVIHHRLYTTRDAIADPMCCWSCVCTAHFQQEYQEELLALCVVAAAAIVTVDGGAILLLLLLLFSFL